MHAHTQAHTKDMHTLTLLRSVALQVPMVYWQYSTPEVLVLEYCPGTKINDGAALDAQGLDRQRLARLAVESYLQQILNHGFFHAGGHVRLEGRRGTQTLATHSDCACLLCGGSLRLELRPDIGFAAARVLSSW